MMKILNSNPISAFGGINFVFKFLSDIKFEAFINHHFPRFKSQSKYSWVDIFYSILAIYLCGGDCIEDLQTHLKRHFQGNPFVNMPSPDTVLRRLAQLSQPSKECMTKRGSITHLYNTNYTLENLNILMLKKLAAFSTGELILDYDNTIIFNEKSDSKMTYKRNPGYQPAVCTLNEEQVLYIENRNGNSDAKSFQLDTIKRLFSLLKVHNIRKPDHFRADAASYQYDVIKLLDDEVNYFYIGCRNSYVEKYFSRVSHWEPLYDEKGEFMEVGEIKITPFQNQTQKPKQYRLIVKRKLKADKQLDIFTQSAYEYRAILTNNFDLNPKEIALFYGHRGNMEKQFDILKNDFGWDNMAFSKLQNNTVFLYITAMCRNLYKKIITYFSEKNKLLKPTFRVKKFLFRFIILPAKWVKQSRKYKLRVYGKLNFSP